MSEIITVIREITYTGTKSDVDQQLSESLPIGDFTGRVGLLITVRDVTSEKQGASL